MRTLRVGDVMRFKLNVRNPGRLARVDVDYGDDGQGMQRVLVWLPSLDEDWETPASALEETNVLPHSLEKIESAQPDWRRCGGCNTRNFRQPETVEGGRHLTCSHCGGFLGCFESRGALLPFVDLAVWDDGSVSESRYFDVLYRELVAPEQPNFGTRWQRAHGFYNEVTKSLVQVG